MKLLKRICMKNFCANCTITNMLMESNCKLKSENTKLKRELAAFHKLKDLNDTLEQILCIRDHRQNQICIAVTVHFDNCHFVRLMEFKEYILNKGGHISQTGIGYSACRIINNAFIILDIGIDEYYQSQGYGSLLLTEILKFAKSLSVSKIKGDIYQEDIDCPEKKERLYHFYEKHGFIIDEDKLILKIR